MKKLSTLVFFVLAAIVGNAQTDCADLYFSEYIEGSSNNKALEIYNPTTKTIDLSTYGVALFSNGATTSTNILALKGKLASGETYKIVNSSANQTLKDLADTFHTVTFYNGDDALILGRFNGTGFDTLDIIGIFGNDPGSNWKVGTGATSEYTLVRKSDVKSGTTRWKKSVDQWDVYAQDEFSYFGPHTSDCIGAPATPQINFDARSYTVSESVGSFYAYVMIDTVAPSATVEIEVMAVDGSATNGTDYTFTTTTLTFTETSWKDSVMISITDNSVYAADANFSLIFSVVNGNGEGDIDTATVTISDDEYPVLSIKELRTNDANEISVWNGKKVWSGGIVNTATSFNASNLNIHFQSGGWGIGTFITVPGYTPQVGDSIVILGTISHYNGLAQFSTVDSFALISSGNKIEPVIVTELNEKTESKLITIENLKLVDPNQWRTSGSFNVTATDGTNTFTIRIDSDTDVDGREAPDTSFTLTGIGNQFDSSDPRNEGYQIFPRNWLDFNLAEYKLSIEELRTNDANEVSIYNSRKVRTSGIINTDVSINGNGIQISIQDGDWAVTIYGGSTDYGFTNYAIGDSIEVVGTLRHFNGLAEVDFVDTIITHGTGYTIEATEVDSMSEMTESKLIMFKNLTLVDAGQWKTSGSFNVDVTNGTRTFAMRVDSDTDIPGMDAPTGSFDLMGIGGQFDGSAPHNSGYQIFPRSKMDIMLHVSAPSVPEMVKTEVYPSPTTGFVYIKTDEVVKRVNVYNLVGSKVKSSTNVVNGIDLSELNNGIYLIETTTISGQVYTHKVVKK